jgi:hypothetical protein
MNSKEGRKPQDKKKNNDRFFVSQYRHYLTGKLMIAKDYGYGGWPFGGGKKK